MAETPNTLPADIGVVVVSFQSLTTIDACLERLRSAAGVAAIRVVDNGSSDGTMAVIQRHATADRRVLFIANPDNPGFGAACNQGAAAIASEDPSCSWLAFVNPDALVEVDTLARLRDLALDRSASGAEVLLGVDLVGEDGRRDPAARRREPDFLAMFSGFTAPLRGRKSRDGRTLAIALDDTLELQPVDAISGALMFLSRTVFQRVGGFDEGYRLHAEDLDLCRRLAGEGVKIAVANRVRVVHVRGVSSRSNPWFVEWHKHRGLWRYFRKFEAASRGIPTRALVFAAICARFPFAVASALLRGKKERQR